jgi:hypothetical protein
MSAICFLVHVRCSSSEKKNRKRKKKEKKKPSYPEIAATTSNSSSLPNTTAAGLTSLVTPLTTSVLCPLAFSQGNNPVAPSRTVTGKFGIDLTMGVPAGNQLCSCATEIPGHMVTIVGLAVEGEMDAMAGAI